MKAAVAHVVEVPMPALAHRPHCGQPMLFWIGIVRPVAVEAVTAPRSRERTHRRVAPAIGRVRVAHACQDHGKCNSSDLCLTWLTYILLGRSEEIPLEDFPHSRNNSPHSRGAMGNPSPSSRSHTPSRALHFDQISVHSGSPRESSCVLGTNALLSQLNGSVAIAREVIPVQSSEETSFIGNDVEADNRRKVRGNIETV